MVAEPAARALDRPLLLIVAMLELLEPHFTELVMFWVVPLL